MRHRLIAFNLIVFGVIFLTACNSTESDLGSKQKPPIHRASYSGVLEKSTAKERMSKRPNHWSKAWIGMLQKPQVLLRRIRVFCQRIQQVASLSLLDRSFAN